MDKLVLELLENGILITLELIDGKVAYNVNTGAKSGLSFVFNEDGSITTHGRYNHTETIESPTMEDLAWSVKSCMHGRDYVSHLWADLMVRLGVLKRVVKTETTYE